MKRLFCIIGKSCSGKDTIFKMLIKDKSLNLRPVITYTTRPKRAGESDGVQYKFVNKDDSRIDDAIEVRSYNTIDGEWKYFTLDDGQFYSDNYIVIATISQYEAYKNYFKGSKVIPIYLEVPDLNRIKLAIAREAKNEKPNFSEVCRRWLADEKDFSEEILKKHEFQKFENIFLSKVVSNVTNYIKSEERK